MKIAFAADPLSDFNLKKDSTYAMMREAAARGHELHAFGHSDMIVSDGRVLVNVSRIALTGEAGSWFRVEEQRLRPLSDVDVVVERTDPPFNMEYIYATYLLELAESQGARVVNRPAAIRNHN